MTETRPFDAAAYMTSPEDVALFLEEASSDAEDSHLRRAVQDAIRALGAIAAMRPASGELEVLRKAILAVVDATRDYLPPDGIGAQECLSRIIGATDNPEINPIIRSLEDGN